MTEGLPKVATLGQVAGNLDAARLIEAAKGKLVYARGELQRIQREHELKRIEIVAVAREAMQRIEAQLDEDLKALDRETQRQATPAREMIDLVKRMLD